VEPLPHAYGQLSLREFFACTLRISSHSCINVYRQSVNSFFIDVIDLNVAIGESDEKTSSEGVPGD